MQHPIWVGTVIYGQTADIQVLLVGALDLLVGEHHLGIHLRLVFSGLSALAERHREVAALLCPYLADNKRERLVSSVAVDVVELARYLCALGIPHEGRANRRLQLQLDGNGFATY